MIKSNVCDECFVSIGFRIVSGNVEDKKVDKNWALEYSM